MAKKTGCSEIKENSSDMITLVYELEGETIEKQFTKEKANWLLKMGKNKKNWWKPIKSIPEISTTK